MAWECGRAGMREDSVRPQRDEISWTNKGSPAGNRGRV